MRLNEAKKNKKYIIRGICDEGELLDRFNKLGFHPGQVVEMKRRAPLFGDPLLIEIEHGQYALTRKEAALVEVSEVDSE